MVQSSEIAAFADRPITTDDHLTARRWILRLALGGIMLAAAVGGMFAVSWDIQWHTAVGRDRTLTAPHLFILGSITVLGLTALLDVLIETVWDRRSRDTQAGSTFAGIFSGTLGAYLAGYGALDAAIGFPLDQYWHTLFGVDVTVWAPFHIMILTGFCICCLGVTAMLAEGAQLATERPARRIGNAGVVVALATLMGVCSFLLLPSLSQQGYLTLGNIVFTVYPLMFGVVGIFVLMVARSVLSWPIAATSVAVVYLCFGALTYLVIPLLMNWLLGVEQQRLLPRAPQVSVVAMQWQYWLIIPAFCLDLVAWLARRNGWTWEKTSWRMFIAAAACISLAALLNTTFLITALYYSDPAQFGRKGAALTASRGVSSGPHTSVVLTIGISLALGVLGVWIGNWLAASAGTSLRRKAQ